MPESLLERIQDSLNTKLEKSPSTQTSALEETLREVSSFKTLKLGEPIKTVSEKNGTTVITLEYRNPVLSEDWLSSKKTHNLTSPIKFSFLITSDGQVISKSLEIDPEDRKALKLPASTWQELSWQDKAIILTIRFFIAIKNFFVTPAPVPQKPVATKPEKSAEIIAAEKIAQAEAAVFNAERKLTQAKEDYETNNNNRKSDQTLSEKQEEKDALRLAMSDDQLDDDEEYAPESQNESSASSPSIPDSQLSDEERESWEREEAEEAVVNLDEDEELGDELDEVIAEYAPGDEDDESEALTQADKSESQDPSISSILASDVSHNRYAFTHNDEGDDDHDEINADKIGNANVIDLPKEGEEEDLLNTP